MSKRTWLSGSQAHARHPLCKRGLSLLPLLLLFVGLTTTAQAQPANGAIPRIVGGVNANPSAYPWMAALLRSNITSVFSAQFCGGTLVGDRWVLTAAHCVDNLNSASEIQVAIGIADLNDISSSERIAVNAIYVHPDYSTSTQDNDIALLELATPSSNSVLAIADNNLTNSIPVGGTLTGDQMSIIGWGNTSATTTPVTPSSFPTLLQETYIPLFDFAACKLIYNDELTSNMLCAAFAEGGKDTCQGDSGGPILYFNSGDNTWYQTGVTSFGNGCAVANNPGVYARAANYIDWINSTSSIALTTQQNFAYHGIGRSAVATLTLRNYSGAGITASAITLSNPTNFSLTSENCTAGVIADNASCSINLQFQAVGAGTQRATLSVDLGSGSTLTSAISGTGLAAIAATALDEAPARSWYSGGDAGWLSTTITNSNGGTAMRSGSIGDGQSSVLLAYFTGPDVLSFRWKAASEAGFDYLNLYVDGVLIDGISGDPDWMTRNINLSAGEHRVAWVYEKDITVGVPPDTVWLDSINMPFTGTDSGSGSNGVTIKSGGGGGSVDVFLLLMVLLALMRAHQYFPPHEGCIKK